MKDTQQFIEDAIEGGFSELARKTDIHALLLNPQAWQAVGKTRGWKVAVGSNMNHEWGQKMHDFIGGLIMGKSIEEALKEL
jgi:hypothetical protein